MQEIEKKENKLSSAHIGPNEIVTNNFFFAETKAYAETKEESPLYIKTCSEFSPITLLYSGFWRNAEYGVLKKRFFI